MRDGIKRTRLQLIMQSVERNKLKISLKTRKDRESSQKAFFFLCLDSNPIGYMIHGYATRFSFYALLPFIHFSKEMSTRKRGNLKLNSLTWI